MPQDELEGGAGSRGVDAEDERHSSPLYWLSAFAAAGAMVGVLSYVGVDQRIEELLFAGVFAVGALTFYGLRVLIRHHRDRA